MKAKVLKSSFGNWLVSFFGSLLLRVMSLSFRWHWVGFDGENRYWVDGPPRVFVFWHSQQLFMPWVYRRATRNIRKQQGFMLISQHGDGRLIAAIIKRLGVDSVAGSSSRGGKEALRFLIRSLASGAHAGITPDGPRGPAEKSKRGVVDLASKTGAPIFPVALVSQKEWRLKSWDRMRIPCPFSPIVAIAGDLISVKAELTKEEFSKVLEEVDCSLQELTSRAEAYFSERERVRRESPSPNTSSH